MYQTVGLLFLSNISEHFTLPQLKIIQKVITMLVFAGFSILYMKESLKLDYLWAGACRISAVFFMFRGS
jgi:uncharacterized protein (DUF486 family)